MILWCYSFLTEAEIDLNMFRNKNINFYSNFSLSGRDDGSGRKRRPNGGLYDIYNRSFSHNINS